MPKQIDTGIGLMNQGAPINTLQISGHRATDKSNYSIQNESESNLVDGDEVADESTKLVDSVNKNIARPMVAGNLRHSSIK